MAEDNKRPTFGLPEEHELEKPVFLASAGDEMEAGVIRSLLASCGIPTRSRSVGIGAYMGVVLGSNRYGIEIDVAESDLETAKNILSARPLSDGTAQRLLDGGDVEVHEPEPEEADEPEADEEEPGSVDESSVHEDAEPEPEKNGTNFWLFLLLLLIGVPLLVALVVRLFV